MTGRALLLLLPAAVAAIFIAHFATAMPLTDEWFFTGRVLALEDIHVFTREGFAELLRIYPVRFGDHFEIVPFLLYWPLSLWTGFDNRALVAVTFACFGVEAFLFRRYLLRSSLWAFPLLLLLFSPSHYMEFFWGWQFTIAFSIVFPVAGLCVANSIPVEAPRLGRLLIAALLIFCGLWSSAGGFFGFPACLLLVLLKPFDRRFKLLASLLLVAAAAAAAPHLSGGHQALGLRFILYVLTALGATAWGSPPGLTEFGIDLRSLTGLLFCVAFAAVLVRAVRVRALPRLALALAIALFGLLSVAAIAVSRDYLGNWHLQYTLFAVCGGYAAAFLLWQEDKSPWASVPFAAICLVTLGTVCGYYNGFATYGPAYRRYVDSIERYAREHLSNPDLPRPYPAGSHLSPEVILYLSALHHPVFHDALESAVRKSLAPGARVYFDSREVALPFEISGGDDPNVVPLTVTLPSSTPAQRLLAQIGGEALVLRRLTHRGAIPLCANPATVCFAGLVLRRTLPRAAQSVQIFEVTP